MRIPHVTLWGTLKPDGTVELEGKPDLPPGRVRVTLQGVPEPPKGGEDWWQYLQRARAELEAMGHRFRTKEEIDADLEDLRSGDDRIEEVYRQIEEEKRRPGERGC